jgi:hypothetical protein
MPPALFALVIFELGFILCPGRSGLWSPLFVFCSVAGMTGVCHRAQPVVEMGSCELLNCDLSDLRLTGVCHHIWLNVHQMYRIS